MCLSDIYKYSLIIIGDLLRDNSIYIYIYIYIYVRDSEVLGMRNKQYIKGAMRLRVI